MNPEAPRRVVSVEPLARDGERYEGPLVPVRIIFRDIVTIETFFPSGAFESDPAGDQADDE